MPDSWDEWAKYREGFDRGWLARSSANDMMTKVAPGDIQFMAGYQAGWWAREECAHLSADRQMEIYNWYRDKKVRRHHREEGIGKYEET